jgi:hypothetical protein
MPIGDDTPIPGVILYGREDHRELLMVLPDGSAVDLMKVYAASLDCVRNWHRDSTLPHFVGDFKRLKEVAEAVNGKVP